ncbi:MAG: sugar phosphate nucleotidyltransferase [Candidatus Omnitrophica bacterium]|nr:sugar phosphate nucleotidyltransferase [Candidatus Omnitrophota bacterium]
MQVVILCGGRGTRLEKETEYRPKPMVSIGSKPILYHIMQIYSSFGFNDFIICLGYHGDVIREYFLNFGGLNGDCLVNTATGKIKHLSNDLPNWNVTLVDTGLNSETGARIKKIEGHIKGDTFLLTYGDAVSDINICQLLDFHKKHGKIASVTGVYPTYKSRFGEVLVKGDIVEKFAEKPVHSANLTSGGFFVVNKGIFGYLKEDETCIFEREPVEDLVKNDQVRLYEHKGFWHCMDTPRDHVFLNTLFSTGKAPWISENRGKCLKSEWKSTLENAY